MKNLTEIAVLIPLSMNLSYQNTLQGSPILDIINGGYHGGSHGQDSEEIALQKVQDGGFEFYPEHNRIWNIIFKTQAGDAVLRHINSSNGYYDGEIDIEELP